VKNRIKITAGPFVFVARMEIEKASATCAKFAKLLPFRNKVIHSRWSGEAVWIPLGAMDTGLEFENHTSHGSRGDLLFYPGGFSETEILFVYGSRASPARWGNWQAIIFSPWRTGAKIWKPSENWFSGMVRRTFVRAHAGGGWRYLDRLAATNYP